MAEDISSLRGESVCPDLETLAAYNAGALEPTVLEALGQHLEQCEYCLRHLLALEDSDSLVLQLRQMLPPEPLLQESGFRNMQARVLALPLGTEPLTRAGTILAGEQEDLPAAAAPTVPVQMGQYRLLERLGRGGMGVVYKALHQTLERPVAIKLLAAERLRDRQFVRRFYREMKAIGKLHHANIVQALDAGEIDGTPYLVMELVDGLDTETVAGPRRPLPVAAACAIVRQTALGLQHIHDSGLIHRDIKPSNLLLSRQGVVKIADLGLAKLEADQAASKLTNSGLIVGTVDYMAPEQGLAGGTVEARTDLYSLGCVLYRLLTGQPLFTGSRYNTTANKLYAHAYEQPAPVASVRADIPPALPDILNRLLAKTPAERFASAGEVAAALAPLSEAADLSALFDLPPLQPHMADAAETLAPSTVGSKATSPLPPRRRRWLGTAVALALLGGAAAAVALVLQSPPEPEKEDPPAVALVKKAAAEKKATEPPQPRYFEDLEPEEIKPLVLYPLFNREPVKLLWPLSELSTCTYQPEFKQLVVHCDSVAIIALGRVKHPSYTFRLHIYQNHWHGGVGLFFGFHEERRPNKTLVRCQRIYLKPVTGELAQKTPLSLIRHLDTYVRQPDGKLQSLISDPLREIFLSSPKNGSHELSVTVRNGFLQSVTWAGAEFPVLCSVEANKSALVADHYGEFGAYSRHSEAVFQNAQIQVYDELRR